MVAAVVVLILVLVRPPPLDPDVLGLEVALVLEAASPAKYHVVKQRIQKSKVILKNNSAFWKVL